MFELLAFLAIGPVNTPAPNPQRARVAAVAAYAAIVEPAPVPPPTPVKPGKAPAINAPPATVVSPAASHAVGIKSTTCPGGVCPLPAKVTGRRR